MSQEGCFSGLNGQDRKQVGRFDVLERDFSGGVSRGPRMEGANGK